MRVEERATDISKKKLPMKIQEQSMFRRHFLVFFLACEALVILGCSLTPYFTTRHGHDQSSYLFEAQRLISGAELYGPHVAETNPPMIIWFSALPVLVARWMHVSSTVLFRILVIALIFGSVAWCVRILRRNTAITNPVSLGFLACAVLAIEFCIGPYNSGQREHLFLILLLPYVLAAATRAVYRLSLAERCSLGIAAGIAIWFKPQDALVLIGLELFLLFRARSLRRLVTPEFLSLVLSAAFVLLLVYVTASLYGKVTVPLLFDAYWALGTVTTLQLILSSHLYLLQLGLVVVVCLIFRRSLRDPATTAALMVCSVAAFYAFAIQHNNWWYHAYARYGISPNRSSLSDNQQTLVGLALSQAHGSYCFRGHGHCALRDRCPSSCCVLRRLPLRMGSTRRISRTISTFHYGVCVFNQRPRSILRF
jgi:hypothetical protein